MDLPKAIRDLFYKKEENKPQAEQSAPIVNETKDQPKEMNMEDPRAIYLGDFPMKEKKEAAKVKEVAADALVKLKQEEGLKPSDLLSLDNQLRKVGLSLEELKKRNDNSLRDLLEGKRTPLVPITPAIAGVEFKTEAKLSVKKDETGTPVLLVHPVKRLLSEVLEKPFEGHTFTNEQKRALMATGNAGEVISITKPDGKQEPVLVSVDRLVNDLVAVPVSKVEAQIPSKFQDQPLPKEQQEMLLAGKAVQVNNIQSKDGNVFSGRLQYNAEKQKVELLPDGLNVIQIRNVVLPEKDQHLLREGKTILVPGLVDGKGEQYNAWVRLDMKSRQLALQKDVPAQQLDTKKEITPGNDFKIQVNQNTKGLKTEENKHVTEPLRHGQTKRSNERYKI